jgi:hypothetical protein
MRDHCDMTALLIFERPARYLDRAVRYLVEVDGRPQAPRLQGQQTIEVPVEAGEHRVRVSAKRRRSFEAGVTVDGETRRLLLVPGPLLSVLDRQPRLVDAATGRRLEGILGSRSSPLDEPGEKHHD